MTRLRLLIEDLLELNRIEGPARPQLTRGRPRDVVLEDVVTTSGSPPAAARSDPLDTGGPAGRRTRDPSQLHRAVLNLASNAVKFSRRRRARCRVRRGHDGDEAEVTVATTASASPTAEPVNVGGASSAASNAVDGQISGTGLGSASCRRSWTRHAGSLAFESVEDEGTTVRLRMPLRGAGRSRPRTAADVTRAADQRA